MPPKPDSVMREKVRNSVRALMGGASAVGAV
jgi:hypothetical protein